MKSFNPFDFNGSVFSSDLSIMTRKVHKKDLATKKKGFVELIEWAETSDSVDGFQDEFVNFEYVERSYI